MIIVSYCYKSRDNDELHENLRSEIGLFAFQVCQRFSNFDVEVEEEAILSKEREIGLSDFADCARKRDESGVYWRGRVIGLIEMSVMSITSQRSSSRDFPSTVRGDVARGEGTAE